ncbi:MAG: FAD-dependent oxidoreductase [Nitrospira sp.]|nr:MAG: FAD-dependent oxidoreductase [Nitrospira sp.]
MESTHYLLIGGGLASNQAAKQLRQLNAEATITLVGEEPYVPYDRPPLSKEFLRGEKTTDQLLFDPDTFYQDKRIDLFLGTAVQHLHLTDKTVRLSNGRTLHFEKALIATGGRPIHLNVPGADLPDVHYLRTVDDAASLAARATPGSKAVLIGAGFIGLEVAASLTLRGVHVTVIESQPRIWPRFAGTDLAQVIQDYCAKRGVAFRTNETAVQFHRHNYAFSIDLKSGATLPCNFLCIGVGIVPNVELAQQAGLAVENGVVVNEFLQTSHPDIYAAGDVANYPDPLFGKRRRVEHWGHAEYCGQLAAQNMSGARNPYDLLTYVWSDIFDLHLEFAGDESEHDQVLTRGRLQDHSFILLYLKQHVLRAYFAVNAGAKDFQPLQRLIRNQKDLSGKAAQLQDSAVPIKSLLV